MPYVSLEVNCSMSDAMSFLESKKNILKQCISVYQKEDTVVIEIKEDEKRVSGFGKNVLRAGILLCKEKNINKFKIVSPHGTINVKK